MPFNIEVENANENKSYYINRTGEKLNLMLNAQLL